MTTTYIFTIGQNYQDVFYELRNFAVPNDKIHLFHSFSAKPDIDKLVETHGTLLQGIETHFHDFNRYNIVGGVKFIRELISRNYSEGEQIAIYIAGGNQVLAMVTMLACYIEYDKVAKFLYFTPQSETITLPIIRWPLSLTKQKILGFLVSGPEQVKDIAGKLGISQGMAYKHINDLVNEGYLIPTEISFTLTPLGKMSAIPVFFLPETDMIHK